MPKVAVIGNCQAQLIEGLLATGSQAEIIALPPNFTMHAGDEARVDQAVAAADFVFVQRTSDDFWLPWARSSVIKARKPGLAWVYPNLYFDGYFPGTQYLYLQHWNKVEGPLVDYHFAGLLAAYGERLSVDAAEERLLRTTDERADPFAASLEQLRRRERDCDIRMSDLIAEVVFESQCFLTPNHPVNALLIGLAERMAELAGLELSREHCEAFGYRLDHVVIPVFDWVAERYRLCFPRATAYKGAAWSIEDGTRIVVGDSKTYGARELVQSYMDLYRTVLPR